MTDAERIWLEPECCAEPGVGRAWCSVNEWTCCPAGECDAPKPTEYVLADLVAAREAAAAEAMRDIAAKTAREACLVPPDGGSPNADEVEVCDEAERGIRALPLPAADALARALERARAEEREACAQELDCGCAARADVLARLATDGEKRASYLCVHGDVCCALQAAAIRTRGQEKNNG